MKPEAGYGAVELRVAVAEDPAVGRVEPVPTMVSRRHDADHGSLQVQAPRRSVELGLTEREDPAVGSDEPVTARARHVAIGERAGSRRGVRRRPRRGDDVAALVDHVDRGERGGTRIDRVVLHVAERCRPEVGEGGLRTANCQGQLLDPFGRVAGTVVGDRNRDGAPRAHVGDRNVSSLPGLSFEMEAVMESPGETPPIVTGGAGYSSYQAKYAWIRPRCPAQCRSE